MPPYIIFSDKTLIDMCVKVPQNKAEMLNVSGVGAMKFEKYGQRFLNAIEEYQLSHPGVVISMYEEEEVEPVNKKNIKKKRTKTAFYINAEDAKNFTFKDLYFISDIKDELNRITTAENTKKASTTSIWEYLVSLELVEERNINGSYIKVQTDKGLQMGIKTVERTSQAGYSYTLLMYPRAVQGMIVDYFIGEREG